MFFFFSSFNFQFFKIFISKMTQPFSKFCRIYCENAALKEALKLRTEEVKTLKSENASKPTATVPLTISLLWNNSGVNYE